MYSTVGFDAALEKLPLHGPFKIMVKAVVKAGMSFDMDLDDADVDGNGDALYDMFKALFDECVPLVEQSDANAQMFADAAVELERTLNAVFETASDNKAMRLKDAANDR